MKIGILASGDGSNAINLIQRDKNQSIACVISDHASAGVLDKAKALGIPTFCVPFKKLAGLTLKENKNRHEEKILKVLAEFNVNWVLLAGYMRVLEEEFLEEFYQAEWGIYRIINIHPSLLPAFPGKDGFGDAYKAKVPTSGISVHLVTPELDAGPILFQQSFSRLANDSLEDFKARGKKIEHKIFPRVLELLAEENRIHQKLQAIFREHAAVEARRNAKHIRRIEVGPLHATLKTSEKGNGSSHSSLKKLAEQFYQLPITGVIEEKIFWIEDLEEHEIEVADLRNWGREVFSDVAAEKVKLSQDNENENENDNDSNNDGSDLSGRTYIVEIGLRPGVTDNLASAASEALAIYVGESDQYRVYSGKLFKFALVNDAGPSDQIKIKLESFAKQELANDLLNTVLVETLLEFQARQRFREIIIPKVVLKKKAQVYAVDLHYSEKYLMALSQKNCWAFSVEEIRHIKNYFSSKKNQGDRLEKGLSVFPTDVEMEIIAQSWSEHCKHKIFNANIEYSDSSGHFAPRKIQSLYKTYIKGATKKVVEEGGVDWTVSVFSDNAGIVCFDGQVELSIKVETHNSPSALDPYGGSLTGILGVNRDILGVGMGSRPIANTNIFCLGDPDYGNRGIESDQLPNGIKHPRQILHGVHRGIEDGGNQSGIPTICGAMAFDDSYCGKPLIFCGTVGVHPRKLPSGRDVFRKYVEIGDRIVVAGGAVGKDGIHGATFSSLEMQATSPATAVQIGDPLTQKRLADFLLEARDLELYSGLTDNGAGGLSSSVGEMATFTGGATIDLGHVPLKYPGLMPYEIMISESQERMTFAVPKEKLAAFMKLAKERGVVATDLGEFTNTGSLEIYYNKERIGNLDLEFLHESLPAMELQAHYVEGGLPSLVPRKTTPNDLSTRAMGDELLYWLNTPNIASKEELVRQYDHEVGACTVVRPFTGPTQEGPNNAGVVWLGPHGGKEKAGFAMGLGLAPQLSVTDAYLMAQNAVDEAVRNVVCVGADPDKIALVDNFCWPDPVGESAEARHKLGQLVRACEGLYDQAVLYGLPFVSGKDSMKNDYSGKDAEGRSVKISALPTLLVTALGHVPDVSKTVTSEFKKVGDRVYCIGGMKNEINFSKNKGRYRKIFDLMQNRKLASCHDISEGGLLVALSEGVIGSGLGLSGEWNWDLERSAPIFFESPLAGGSFVISVSAANSMVVEDIFQGEIDYLGTVTPEFQLHLTRPCHGVDEIKVAGEDLRHAWKRDWQ